MNLFCSKSRLISPRFTSNLTRAIGKNWLNLKDVEPMDKRIKKGQEFISQYVDANDIEKAEGITYLTKHLSVDFEKMNDAIKVYQRNPNIQSSKDVYISSRPEYMKLFQSLANVPEGIQFLCNFRADLIKLLKTQAQTSPGELSHLIRMDLVLKDMLTNWFSLSNLSLQRVTWDSSASLIQKLVSKEAVHPAKGLIDVKRRMGDNRRCFIFVHSAMPDEPLIVVYVALMNKIADNVQEIVKGMDLVEKNELTTANYYSISSLQDGLKGIDLGNLLIKSVVRELQKEAPKVRLHSTISPIPGFRNWLLRCLHGNSNFEILDQKSIILLKGANFETSDLSKLSKELIILIESNSLDVYEQFKDFLMHSCARYICDARTLSSNFPINPVAHFHLHNGAQVYRLNWRGNTNSRGIEQSCGLMVNYFYDIEKVQENSAKYINNKTVHISDKVRNLL
uniref:Malonyl-CoA decarboxylase, mitochondrial n=1 Tax=Rhabditophanes sp. KR3021 TaxID=114890 RepID=A0AC35TJX3_9BILA